MWIDALPPKISTSELLLYSYKLPLQKDVGLQAQLGHLLNLCPMCSYSRRLSLTKDGGRQGLCQARGSGQWWPLHQLVTAFYNSSCFPGGNRETDVCLGTAEKK